MAIVELKKMFSGKEVCIACYRSSDIIWKGDIILKLPLTFGEFLIYPWTLYLGSKYSYHAPKFKCINFLRYPWNLSFELQNSIRLFWELKQTTRIPQEISLFEKIANDMWITFTSIVINLCNSQWLALSETIKIFR